MDPRDLFYTNEQQQERHKVVVLDDDDDDDDDFDRTVMASKLPPLEGSAPIQAFLPANTWCG